MKRNFIALILGAFLFSGCTAGTLTNLTKEGVDGIDTALGDTKASHVLILNLWAKHYERILAYIGNDLYGLMSSDDASMVTEFTHIADTPPSQRTNYDIGRSERILHKIAWKGLRPVIMKIAPDLLSVLPGL